ncbi:MAG: flagellar hook-length control protein FliK [Desulfobulbaceae bacterium]|nr:flagellar hook-length control protein FliK [Desulfobulbaceae bacterium]
MSLMMNPVLPVPGVDVSAKRMERNSGSDNSFAGHLDRHLDNKYYSDRDKLGVRSRSESQSQAEANRKARSKGNNDENISVKKNEKTNEENSETIASFLSQFMSELEEVAEQNVSSPGEWNVELPDLETIKQLAEDAGMSSAEIAQFLQQLDASDHKVDLTEFFTLLSQHFEQINEGSEVTVPEAELPLLESFLAKMGIPEQDITRIAQEAVTRDGVLDLAKFLQGLQSLQTGAQAESNNGEQVSAQITLTDWEAEQLQSILAQAGVTLEEQNELLPERFLNQVLGNGEAGKPVELTLDRLESILAQGISDAQKQQPQVDLPSFLTDLQHIVSQSNFENNSVGWTPVVQETVTALFQKIQELADLARAKVEEGRFFEEQDLDEDFVKWLNGLEKKFAQQAGQEGGANFSQDSSTNQSGQEMTTVNQPLVNQSSQETPTVFTVPESGQGGAVTADSARLAEMPRIPPQQLQQQVVQQLSTGVMRGLQNQEHHLVLRLYPQDLGEVKVNLVVHDDQVSVSFKMENSRVKEMLESNMQEFKDSMGQKGFQIGECSVSVGQQDDNGQELWQRFEQARKTIGAARKTLEDLPDDVLYHRVTSMGADGRENGVSIFV